MTYAVSIPKSWSYVLRERAAKVLRKPNHVRTVVRRATAAWPNPGKLKNLPTAGGVTGGRTGGGTGEPLAKPMAAGWVGGRLRGRMP